MDLIFSFASWQNIMDCLNEQFVMELRELRYIADLIKLKLGIPVEEEKEKEVKLGQPIDKIIENNINELRQIRYDYELIQRKLI
jgi:hypothetical protein